MTARDDIDSIWDVAEKVGLLKYNRKCFKRTTEIMVRQLYNQEVNQEERELSRHHVETEAAHR